MNEEKIKNKISELITKDCNKEALNLICNLLRNSPEKLSLTINNLIKESERGSFRDKGKYHKWFIIPGAYLIYYRGIKKKDIVYVGETDDLIRRIKGDISGSKVKNANNHERITHTFVNIVKDKFNLESNEQLQKKLKKYFLFSYVTTQSKVLAQIIEDVILEIYYNQLWNKEAEIKRKATNFPQRRRRER